MEAREEQTPTTPRPEQAHERAHIIPAPDVEEGVPERRAEEQSILHLLRQLTDQVTTLFTKEMALARSEVRQAVSAAKVGIGSLATGAAVLFGGFLVLLFAAVAALALELSTWLSALIVGGIAVIIGAIMLYVGKNRLEPSAFKPDRTAEQLRRDQAMAKSELQHRGSR